MYDNNIKTYVAVDVLFDDAGRMTPLAVTWDDGRVFPIDRVLEVRRAASRKAGGQGVRYTCRIKGNVTYLYYEDPRWFVERKGA